MTAIQCCPREDIVHLMLDKNPNIDLQSNYGKTALIMAIENGQSEIAQMLIKNGANLDLSDMNGNTALMIAVRGCPQFEVVKMILEKKPNSVDFRNNNGKTALMMTLEDEKHEFAKMFIEYGANLMLADNNGDTALMIASGTHYGMVIRPLDINKTPILI